MKILYYALASKASAPATSDTAAATLTIPGELGFNTYYQYMIKSFNLGVYTGYDYEKLNTFNTHEIVNGTPIKNIENNLHYATVGATKGFTLFDLKMNFKASISQTLASSSTGSGKSLSGYKYILYYTYKPEGRFSFSAFFKHHELEGPTKLSINRFGLSVGISIF
ncbi:MAG: hypothetical protein U0T83_11285 [Bacteriovoracaceae bacterium]